MREHRPIAEIRFVDAALGASEVGEVFEDLDLEEVPGVLVQHPSVEPPGFVEQTGVLQCQGLDLQVLGRGGPAAGEALLEVHPAASSQSGVRYQSVIGATLGQPCATDSGPTRASLDSPARRVLAPGRAPVPRGPWWAAGCRCCGSVRCGVVVR
jgi:hypothetical protein